MRRDMTPEQQKEPELDLEKFKKFINSKHKIFYRENTNSYRIIFNDFKFCNDFLQMCSFLSNLYNYTIF